MPLDEKRTLNFALLKYLQSQLQDESLSADAKKSREDATKSLQSCLGVSLEDKSCDIGLDQLLLGVAEKSVKANNLKNEGNDLMKEKKYKEALDRYNKAIEIDSNNAVFYSNRAAANYKLGDFANAIKDSNSALKIDPRYA